MPNETKRIAVRPNQGSALQRAVDKARETGEPVSLTIHRLAAIAEKSIARPKAAHAYKKSLTL